MEEMSKDGVMGYTILVQNKPKDGEKKQDVLDQKSIKGRSIV